jgi:hypothetical protein
MSKWIWRWFDSSEQDKLWFKLLQAKYVNVDNIFAVLLMEAPSSGVVSTKSSIFKARYQVLGG